MRGLVAIVVALPLALAASVVESSAAEECMIGDSALCLANPNCHWDGEKRGCYPGAAEHQDACAVHGDQQSATRTPPSAANGPPRRRHARPRKTRRGGRLYLPSWGGPTTPL